LILIGQSLILKNINLVQKFAYLDQELCQAKKKNLKMSDENFVNKGILANLTDSLTI
jgi:hypothetical protein